MKESFNINDSSSQNEKRLKSILDNLQDAFLEADLQGYITFVNSMAVTMYGYNSMDELLGKPAKELYASSEERDKLLRELKKTGKIIDWNGLGLKKDGTSFWVSMNVQFIKDDADQVIGTQGLVRDISERSRTLEALRQSEERNRLLSDVTMEGILIHHRGIAKEMNQAVLKLFGDESVKLINKSFLHLIHEDDRDKVVKNMMENYAYPFEVRAFRGDGEVFFLEMESKSLDYQNEQWQVTALRDITWRKQQENEYKQLIDGMNDSAFVINFEGQFVEVNDTALQVLGYSRDEMLQMKVFDLDSELKVTQIQELIQGMKTFERQIFETQHRTKGGRFIPVEISSSPVQFHGNAAILSTARDITERKLSAEAIRRSEEKFRKAFFTSPDSIAINRLEDGMYISINKGFTQILGYTEDDVYGKTSLELNIWVNPEDRKRLGEALLTKGIVENMEARFRSKNDLMLDGLMSATIIELEGVSHILSITRDITERKKIEKALSRSEKELKKAQQITHIGSWYLDTETQDVVWTEELYKMYGFNSSLPPPPYTEHSKLFTADSWELLESSITHTNESGIPYELELRTVRADGTNGWMWVRGESVKDESGKTIGLWGAAQDITQRKLTEEALVQAKEKAEESDRLKSAFLANMSHEIRTPMNGILGFAELLKEPGLTGEMQQEYIRIIEKAGARMLNIITDIVDISKIESGQMLVSESETNVNEQMDFLGKFFSTEAENKGLNLLIRNSLISSKAFIWTDREKLYAILTNLIKNAIKYTQEGFIEIGCQKKDDFLEFYVKDSGVGIPNDRQSAIFERFIQADVSNKMARQGAGLGLSISKAYVEMLGGEIWVESEFGRGSTFYFTLPNKTKSMKDVRKESTLMNDVELHPSRQLKVLIAEDDEASMQLLTVILKEFGHTVLTAENGQKTLDVFLKNPTIDLILMDIDMPVMNGYETTEQIRKLSKEVIILAQTAFGLAGDKEKSLLAGCNDYLAKPINKEELQRFIKKYFN